MKANPRLRKDRRRFFQFVFRSKRLFWNGGFIFNFQCLFVVTCWKSWMCLVHRAQSVSWWCFYVICIVIYWGFMKVSFCSLKHCIEHRPNMYYKLYGEKWHLKLYSHILEEEHKYWEMDDNRINKKTGTKSILTCKIRNRQSVELIKLVDYRPIHSIFNR